jgi:hypothetical protein
VYLPILWGPELCPVVSVTKSLRSVLLRSAELYKRGNIGGIVGVCIWKYTAIGKHADMQ